MSDMDHEDEDPELIARIRAAQITLLQSIPRRRREFAENERVIVHGARQDGLSWDEIGAAIGITAAEALQQYGEPAPGEEDDE